MFLDGSHYLVSSFSETYKPTLFETPLELLQTLETGMAFDLIVADLVMPSMNGLAFVSVLRTRQIETPVLIVSGTDTPLSPEDFLNAGANGFLSKQSSKGELARAFAVLLDGQNFFNGEAMQSHRARTGFKSSRESDSQQLPKLSSRQVEILQAIAAGSTNKDVSEALSISENTVKTHLKQIFAELGVTKRTACIRRAQAYGLI